ncbi:MAG: helix-turn-helix domain-containing protein [Gemmataceae bacterium]
MTATPANRAWAPPRFVPLPENRSARLAVRRLALSARRPFHPLLLHGPPGTGKSHLAGALHEFAAENGSCRRLTAGDWLTEDVSDLRSCEFLIVEDVQHLPERAIDDLAVLLDYRGARRRATLITASLGPAELDLPARLTSRLAGGLVVGLELLGRSSRRRLLVALARQRKLTVSAAVLDELAGQTPGSGRQLLAALVRAAAGGPAEAMPAVTLERITQQVSRHFRVRPQLVRGRDRTPNLLWPRQVSMYLARRLTGLTLAQVGEFFGRDHSTVRHACQKVEDALADYPQLPGLLRQLEAELR